MKKILSIILCLLLLSVLAMPVFAAQTAKMTVTASKTDLKPGDKVSFTVSVTKVENCTIGGFLYKFDENVFEYVSGKSHAGLKGFVAGVSTAANKVAGYFMNGKATLEGDLFSITLKVREDAKAGTYTVTGRPSLTSSDAVECTAVGAQVTVSDGTAASDKVTPTVTVPDVSLPSVPTPIAPGQADTPAVDATLDSGNAPLSGDIALDKEGPVEENKHVEDAPELIPQKPSFPWWIVAVIVAVAAGGAVFLILEFRKTKKAQ